MWVTNMLRCCPLARSGVLHSCCQLAGSVLRAELLPAGSWHCSQSSSLTGSLKLTSIESS